MDQQPSQIRAVTWALEVFAATGDASKAMVRFRLMQHANQTNPAGGPK